MHRHHLVCAALVGGAALLWAVAGRWPSAGKVLGTSLLRTGSAAAVMALPVVLVADLLVLLALLAVVAILAT